MRILCITSQRASLTNVRPEAEIFIGLQKAGCNVTVMTEADSDYAPLMRAAGIRVVDFRTTGKFSRASIANIRAELTGQDIVYAFNNNAIANMIAAARGLEVKVVTYRGQTGNISRWDPSCYLTHLNPRVDAIICVADAVRRSVAQQLRHPDKAVTIYKGHDLAWYADVKPADLNAYGIEPDALVVMCVSNYRPRKGLETLVDSFAVVDGNAHLVLVGSGTDNPKLARRATRSIDGARFHALGFQADAMSLAAAADIGVLPALRREGLPKTVIEAMVCRVPVVVTDTGGNAELVDDGVTGLVVAPGDEAALGAAIQQLVLQPAQRRIMGAAGRKRIETHFSHRETVRQTLAVFRQLMAGGDAIHSS